MRVALLIALAIALGGVLWIVLKAEPDSPDEPPAATRAGTSSAPHSTARPETREDDPGPGRPGGGEARGGRPADPAPEPSGWTDIERVLTGEPDRVSEVTRRDLATTTVSIEFRGTPLEEAARSLSRQAGHAIAVRPAVYEIMTRDELKVTVGATTVSAAEALDSICAALRITWWIDGARIFIAPVAPRPERIEIEYPVAGLESHEPDGLADLIREKIAPASWEEEGTSVRGDAREVRLIVRAPRATQRKVLALLRSLLRGEGKPEANQRTSVESRIDRSVK